MVGPLPWRNSHCTKAVDGMLDIGREYADCIERQANAGGFPQPWHQKSDGAGDLTQTGQENSRLGQEPRQA